LSITPIEPFLIPVASDLWDTTRELRFNTREGEVIVPIGFRNNLYTGVSNTNYVRFWLPAVLHDFACEQIRLNIPDRVIRTKRQADLIFYDEMLVQSALIMLDLREVEGTAFAIAEYRSLLRRSWIYYKGVSGPLGTVYWLIKG